MSGGLQKLRLKAKKVRHGVTFKDEESEKKDSEETSEVAIKKRPSHGLFYLIKELFKFFGNLLLNSRFSIDELINIARPVIYLYSILRFGRRSFKPLKISLVMDLVQILFSCLRMWRSNREKRKLEEQDVNAALNRPKNQPLLYQASVAVQSPEIEVSTSNRIPDKRLHFLLRNIEVQEITRRCYLTLMKYLVRDPIFSIYTKPLIVSLLRKVRIPNVAIAYLFAYINYYRYYTYIS